MERKALFVTIGIIVSLLLITCQTEQQTSRSFTLSPPMQGVDIEFTPYSIDAVEGGTIALDNGGSIVVPPNAFVNENGEEIKGTVTIDFREFHDSYDILLSGIPMVYDSAGVQYNFETAGMFEINGYAGNDAVYIKDGSSIQVNLASYNEGNDFGFYSMNEESGSWEYVDKAKYEMNVEKKRILDSLSTFKDKPVKPLKASQDGKYLDFNILYHQFPELKEISSVMWQYTGNNAVEDPDNNKWIFEETWASLDLAPYNSELGQYKLTLSNNTKSFETTVSAVLIGGDYDKALQAFQSNMQNYREKFTERVEEEQRANLQADILRSYQISNFGIYNWDRFSKQPNVLAVNADFEFDVEISESANITVYLITEGERSLVKYPKATWRNFAFSLESNNKLVAVIPGNKIAVFTSKDFEKIDVEDLASQEAPTYTFKMTTIDKKIEKPEDLKNIMQSV